MPLELFLLNTLPLVVAVSLAISLPASVVAVAGIAIVHRYRPRASEREMVALGSLIGALVPIAAILPVMSWRPLSSPAGVLFWVSFLVAAIVAGGWVGVRSGSWLEQSQ